jgi:menaquinone-dependent protoporphyrinogen IX oxidase
MKEDFRMNKILVTYATNSGSTFEVAKTIMEELQRSDAQVELLPIPKVTELASYSAVVLGAPMILGWHRLALKFLQKNKKALATKPLAIFVTCMSLTKTGETNVRGVPVSVDANLPKPPKNANRLAFKERYSLVSNYLRPILDACQRKPVSVGVFGGQLNFSQMKWWAMIFVVLILQAQAGDKRNWDAIRAWAGSLPALFDAPASERVSA